MCCSHTMFGLILLSVIDLAAPFPDRFHMMSPCVSILYTVYHFNHNTLPICPVRVSKASMATLEPAELMASR